MLDKVIVRTDGKYKDVNLSTYKSLVRQKGNSKWFSTVKVPLATYSMSGQDSTRWLNRLLRNMGEAPVVFDTMQAMLSCRDLRQQLKNEGYLGATVDFSTFPHGKRKTDAVYILHPGDPYYIRNIRYQIEDSVIARLLCMEDTANWGLRCGMKFNVSALDAERKRLTGILLDHGYYRFHKEFISVIADTVSGSRDIDITVSLYPYRTSTTPDTLHTCYTIRNVEVVSGDPLDSVVHLRQKVIRENIYIQPHRLYSSTALQNTYNRFGRLPAVRYTNVSFTEVPDTSLLDCRIQLSTNKPSSISFQPEGTNTAGDLGAAATLTYQNRNLFRGSETFSVELRGAYEAIKGLEGYRNQDYVEYSVQTKLAFPRFILPFIGENVRRRSNASTEVSVLYDLQNRPEFHRRVLSGALRYKWNTRNHHDSYQVDLIDVNYVFMPWISETFYRDYLESESNRNAILRYNYQDLFIAKVGFGYSYNNGIFAVKTNLETAGNLLNLGSRLFGAETDADGHYRLFNIAYAQYLKGDFDFTRNVFSDYHNQLVFHFGLGVAYPYGNSTVLPFEKRYFSGGANSVRGWSVRGLGPGRYHSHNGEINFLTQTGDMKLDLNLEFRTYLFWKLGCALFLDAGNIWTLREYDDQPGGKFVVKDALRDLAVSYGFGLRFNFDYFILRFDMGMKAVNPAYQSEDEQHFPVIHPRLSRDFAFHFAVGLPF